ncbi:MAG: YbbR-like domain-containing protein YbbR [Bacillaceae bacterium]|nr:MAG: YbbR-like domain-containing protein YbbR [Bacillaceae bacterium]
MDKLMNSNWFMRIIALLLALMLYASVNIESPASNNEEKYNIFESPSTTETATITDVPVNVYYDDRAFVVTGIPQTVTVTIEGPKSIVTTTKQVKDFEIFADLTDLSVGTHSVRLKHKNLSDQLEVDIDPAVITVGIHEKVSENFPVEVDVINKNKMKEGYIAERPIVKPDSVKITGAKEHIDAVAVVKATVSLEGADGTVVQKSKVAVYDANGNILPVTIEPSAVTVTVPVESPTKSKSVPLKIKTTGKLSDGLSISSIQSIPSQVTIYGPKDVLEQIESIDDVSVDLSKIKENATVEADVPAPDGVTNVVPNKVQIKIDIEKREEKTFKQVPIKVIGLGNDQEIEFIDPDTGKLDVVLRGKDSVLKNVKESDIELYVNVAGLDEGEHEVNVEAKNRYNLSTVLSSEKVKIRLSNKENSLEEADNERRNQIEENNDSVEPSEQKKSAEEASN